jgi:hypothetical protein
MRTFLAAAVILMGVVVMGAGAVAMYNHGIIADETGVSGWNPALWLVLLGGALVVLLGTVQIARAVGADSTTSRES